MSKAKSIFLKLEQKIKENTVSDNNVAHSSIHNVLQESVKLPTIQLPKFNGSYDHWMEFRDIFNSLIHSNGQISNTSKFQYLRASLEGTAAQVIKSIQITSDNYDMAWSILCDRFDNKRLLVQNHVRALFNIDNISRESSNKIRTLCDDVFKHLRSLKQLGEQVDAWDTLIIFIVTSKLDSVTNKEWEKYKSDLTTSPTLEDLKIFLKNRADLLETVETNVQEKRFTKKEQTRGLFSKQPLNVCIICKKDHLIYTCQDFLCLDVKDRMAKARELKLCINCLKERHHVKDCRSIGGCRKCRGRHNTLLHEENSIKDANNTGIETAAAVAPKEKEAPATSLSAFTKNVLLSTAQIYVGDSKGTMHVARALLDSGSQTSFMTEELADRKSVV